MFLRYDVLSKNDELTGEEEEEDSRTNKTIWGLPVLVKIINSTLCLEGFGKAIDSLIPLNLIQ